MNLTLITATILFHFTSAFATPGMLDQAVALEKKGKLKEAIQMHEKIAQKFPKLKVASYVTIGGLYGKQGKFDEEIKWCQKAIAIDPKFANSYVNLGSAYAAKQDILGAEKAFSRALELEPRNAFALYSLGLVAEAKDDLKQAEKLYTGATEADPGLTDAWVNLGVTQAKQKNFKEAKAALKKAESLDPKAEDIQNLLKKVEAHLAK